MNEKNINKKSGFSRVLVAPLDWGLGHATRCIPIIHALLKEKAVVFVAAEGAIKKLIQKEFQNVTILPLKGYRISYSANKWFFFIKMFAQIPKILSVTRYEKNWLAAAIAEHKIDAVISDNRFGLRNKNIKSIYITHQLHIETGSSWLNRLAQKIHYKYIHQFDECWVPDAEGDINLAGKLSHPKIMPAIPVKYLGPLSRFKKISVEKTTDLLFLISGPEPQRSIFEKQIFSQADSYLQEEKLSITIVRGLPEETSLPAMAHASIVLFNHLPADALSSLIQQSELVVARSGYSTVMDLVAIQQKALLIPTPGQTEQEYLAVYLDQQKIFIYEGEGDFAITEVLWAAENFEPRFPGEFDSQMENIIHNFLRN